MTITLLKAVAEENNHGTIASTQKVGRTANSHRKPGPKPSLKPGSKPCEIPSLNPRGKPGPKPSTKHKRTEVESVDSGEPIGPRKLRKQG